MRGNQIQLAVTVGNVHDTQVRGEVLRVRERDIKCKTTQRYFVIREEYYEEDDATEPTTNDRWGELLGIFKMLIGGRPITLCHARWFSAAAGTIDLDTETPRLRLDLAWDRSLEVLIEAEVIVSIVVVVPLPYSPNMAIVLDRRFDTTLIPGSCDALSSDEDGHTDYGDADGGDFEEEDSGEQDALDDMEVDEDEN